MGSRVHAARVTELHMKATRPAQQKLFFCNSHVGVERLGRRKRTPAFMLERRCAGEGTAGGQCSRAVEKTAGE
jgi:hypothetical protein